MSTEQAASVPMVNDVDDDWSGRAFLDDKAARKPEFLVESFLPECSLTMLAATPGSGKTFFSLALCLAVARGTEFAGWRTRQAPVLFIGEDAPTWDYAGQLRMLLGQDGDPPDDFHIVTNRGFHLFEPDWRSRLPRYLSNKGVKLLVIDTLRAVHDRKENDSGEMQAVMNVLRWITTESGVSLLFLHHGSKPSGDGGSSYYRGSSVLLGSCDFSLSMASMRLPEPHRKRLVLSTEKGRSRNSGSPTALVLDWSEMPATICRVEAKEERPIDDTVAQLIADRLGKGPAGSSDLIQVVPSNGRSEKTVRGWIDKILKEWTSVGAVESEWSGGKLIWTLTEQPSAAPARAA